LGGSGGQCVRPLSYVCMCVIVLAQPTKRPSGRELSKAKSFVLDAQASSAPFSYTYVR
jgi:hypothetical protein